MVKYYNFTEDITSLFFQQLDSSFMLEWPVNPSYMTVGRPQWFLMEIGCASSVYLRATCALVISCNASRKLEIKFLWRSKVGNYGRCGDMTWHYTFSVFWRTREPRQSHPFSPLPVATGHSQPAPLPKEEGLSSCQTGSQRPTGSRMLAGKRMSSWRLMRWCSCGRGWWFDVDDGLLLMKACKWMLGRCGRLIAALTTAETAGTETQHTARRVARAHTAQQWQLLPPPLVPLQLLTCTCNVEPSLLRPSLPTFCLF